MTFDDRLRRAFDTLSDRLRDEIERQIRDAIDELAASARDERDAVVAAAQADRDAAIQSAHADRDAAIRAAEVAREAAVASAEAERDAAIASAQSDRDDAVAAAQADRDAALASAQAERDAAVAAATSVASTAAAPSSTGDELIGEIAAGVRAMSRATSLTAVLQALMDAAGASGAISTVWLLREQRLQPWRHHSSDATLDSLALDADNPIANAARSNRATHRDEMVALPLTLAGEVVAVLVTASPQPPAPNADALEVLALYASRALESITAFKTARALTRQPEDGAAPQSDRGTDDVSPEDQASAKRYAKLLVSEIKLYHEPEVVSGQRERDLMSRLGGEIARARVMYEQRVPPHVRRQADYFHDELVRTLANGDPALLEVRS